MAEPTVQVPVSLIHALVDTVGSKGMPTDVYLALDALLSQPTPTADRVCTCDADAYLHRPACPFWFPPHLGEPRIRPEQRVQPETPRIEDMAPGTTFTARVALPGAVDDRFTVVEGPRNIWLRGEQYEVTVPDRIDPSTIRDVQPPKEPTA